MMDHEISRSQKQDLQRYASDFSNFGDDYFFARFDRLPIEGILSGTPTRVTGLAIILMLKGRMTVDVNLATYGMIPDSVLLVRRKVYFSLGISTMATSIYACFSYRMNSCAT